MPNTTQIADILFKKGLGLGTTQSGRSFFEEPIQGRVFVVPNQVWTQAEEISNTAPVSTSGIVQKVEDYDLAQVLGTTNSFSGELLKDAIPFNWGDGTSYNYSVKDSTDSAIAFGVNDWVVDTEAGILMFNDGVPSNMPPKMSFYRYSGSKGVGGGGGAGDVVSINGVTGLIELTGQGNVSVGVNGTLFSIGGTFVTPSETGGFLDHTSGTLLFDRDVGLSDNIVALSGAVDAASAGVSSINGESGIVTFNGVSGVTVTNVDSSFTFSGSLDELYKLSNNVAVLSGNIVFTNETGGLLDLSDLAALESRDTELSNNVATLSGNVVFSSETGDFLDPTDTTYLEGRDTELSNNVAALSGDVAFSSETGDFLNSTDLTSLEARDTELSNNVATLSGNVAFSSDTGDFLDPADTAALEARDTNLSSNVASLSGDLYDQDTELSDNIASLSGNIVFNSETGGLLDLADQTALEARDTELGNNVATLSGNVVFSSETGDFLDPTDATYLEGRDDELSSNVASLSGDMVFSSETGGLLDHKSGTLLFDRDTELSDNVASLSGAVLFPSDTGGLLDLSDLTSLEARDTELSNNVATLSGDVAFSADTGDFLDPTDATYLEERDDELSSNVATLSGNVVFSSDTGDFLDPTDTVYLEGRDTNLSSNVATLSGNLIQRDVGLSDNIADVSGLIAAASAGVSAINGESGTLTFVGANGLTITATNGDTFTFSGEHSVIESLSGNLVASGAAFNETGLDLWNRDLGLSAELALISGQAGGGDVVSINGVTGLIELTGAGNVSVSVVGTAFSIGGTFITPSETGGFLDLTDQTALEGRDTELSNNVATLSGNIVFSNETGGFLDLADQTDLESRDTELSNNVASLSGDVAFSSETGDFLDPTDTIYLEGRDDELSNNIAALSGIIPAAINTGGFLDHASGKILWDRDEGLVASITDLSGNVVFDSETGDFLDPTDTIYLEGRDDELSSNVATLSGNVVFNSETGGLLDLADQAALEARDTELSNNVSSISGNVDTNATNITSQTNRITSLTGSLDATGFLLWQRDAGLSSSIADLSGAIPATMETGGLLDHASGKILWDRDEGLSINISSLSGDVVFSSETGGLLDLANLTALEARDDELGANVATLSGNVAFSSDTGDFLDPTDTIYLEGRDDELGNNLATLSGNVVFSSETGGYLDHSSGSLLFDRDTELSDNLADISGLIGGGDVTQEMVDSLSGNLVATGGVFNTSGLDLFNRDIGLSTNLIALSGNTVFNSETGDFLDPTDTAALEARDTELSNNVASLSGNTVFDSETGGFLDLASQTALESRDLELSNNVATLSGTVSTNQSNIVFQTNRVTSLSGNVVASGGVFNTTGLNLWNRDIGLSDNIVDLSGDVSTLTTRFENDITGVKSLDSLTGDITFADAGSVTVTQNGQEITISGQVGSGDLTAAIFTTTLLSGVQTQWIEFPESSTTEPVVNISIENTGSESDLPSYGLSGLTKDGYWLNTSFPIDSSGYIVHTYTNLTNVDIITDESGTLLWNRDVELSDNLALVSGAGGWNHASGTLLWDRDGSLSGSMDETGLDLWNRDLELSNNLADVSGLAGGWDHSSGTLLWDRDDSLSGSMDETGLDLFNRDIGLSDNFATFSGQAETAITLNHNEIDSLSGSLVASGGTFNQSGLDLFNRDLQLSDNVASISGLIDDGFTTIDLWTTPETLTDSFNNRNIILSAGTDQSGFLEDSLTVGFSIGLYNINVGQWTFSGSFLRDLNDSILSEYTLKKGNFTSFILESGNNWRVYDDNIDYVETTETGILWTRDSELGDGIVELSGNVVFNSETGGFLDLSSGDYIDEGFTILVSGNILNNNRIGSLSGSMNETGLDLWNRDLELSDNLASVSGLAGGWDHSSGTLLWNRDDSLSGSLVGLSDEVALISGSAGGWDHASGTLLWNRDDALSGSMDETGLDLFNRDLQLSDNVATLSGNAVFSSETGGLLDLASGDYLNSEVNTLWQGVDANFNSIATLSNNVVASGGVFNSTGLDLWNRDLELSNNLASVSGLAGGWDHSSGTLLWNRDLSLSGEVSDLSDNVASISGLTKTTVDHWDVSETLTNDYDGRYIILSAGIPQTGGLVNDLNAGFSANFLNVNDGDWVFTGENLRDLNDNDLTGYVLYRGQIANFTMESGTNNWRIVAGDEYATGGYLDHASGTLLFDRDTELSDNLASVSGLAGGWDHSSGTLLWNRDLSLSGEVAELSDNVALVSGLADPAAVVGLSDNVATLSGDLETRDLNLSNNVATLSGTVASNTSRDTELSNNVATLSGDLETRDLNLSNNVATLSGTVSTNTSNIGTNTDGITDLKDISGAAQKALFVDYITDEENFPFFFTDRPLSCLSVHSVAKGESATASITWTLDYGTDATAAGTQIIGDTTTSITTVDTNTTFDQASIPANNFVLLRTTATGASTTGLSITLIHE